MLAINVLIWEFLSKVLKIGMKENLRGKTILGVAWQFSERMLSQVITFVLQIILARILFPEDYGIIALIGIFTQVLLKIITAGFATGLIQKKDADNLDFSTVFYFSIFISVLFYSLLFILAPIIALFFKQFPQQILIDVIRVLGVGIIISAINSVQRAYVSRQMDFKHFFKATLGAKILSASVGIAMAYNGYGVWALVTQILLESFVSTLTLWCSVKWRPLFAFSFERLKGLFSYGWKIFTASIIKVIYNDIRGLVIAKVYTANDLAFYNRGQTFPQLVDTNISGTIESVLFPAISKIQDEPDEMLRVLRRAIKTSCFIVMPLLAILAGIGDNLIEVLLTSKWLPSVVYLQILSFSFILAPVEVESLQAIKAIGRSDLVLKLEVIKRTIGILTLVLAVPFGVKAIALSTLISSVLSAMVNIYPTKKVLGYTFKQQIVDVAPTLLLAILVFVIAWSLNNLDFNIYITLFIQIVVSGIIYILSSILLKIESFYYLKKMILNRVK